MEKKKIFSGDFKYVCRVSRNFAALGWRIVKQKRWGDGKWTFVMEYADVQNVRFILRDFRTCW